jgi:uncharacterized membrane protein YdjX (TVP38/TMEM64 family)
VPYRFLDIVAGLTKISFTQYFVAALLGSPLRIFWLQFILTALGKSIFEGPMVILRYFYMHPAVLILSFLYAIASVIVGIFIRRYLRLSKQNII